MDDNEPTRFVRASELYELDEQAREKIFDFDTANVEEPDAEEWEL